MRRAEGRKEGRVRQYNKGKRGGEEPRGKCKAEKGHGHMGVGGGSNINVIFITYL